MVENVALDWTTSIGGATAARHGDAYTARTPEGVLLALRRLLAGRAAEEVVLGEVLGGVGGSLESDLAQATYIATAALASYGVGPEGAHA